MAGSSVRRTNGPLPQVLRERTRMTSPQRHATSETLGPDRPMPGETPCPGLEAALLHHEDTRHTLLNR